MRSLWRLMALRWLGGEGAEDPAGDSVLGALLLSEEIVPAFRVTRDPHARAAASTAPKTRDAGKEADLDLDASRRA